MNILLLIAHGSRNPIANAEIEKLAQAVENITAEKFTAVLPAFLEFAEPNILTGIDRCVERGASRISVLPYFLAAGNHVSRDIPGQLETARQKYTEVDIELCPHIGAVDAMAGLVAQCAQADSRP